MPTELDWPVSGGSFASTTPQLRINGWPIPIAADKADLSDEEIGTRDRGANAQLRLTRTDLKQLGDFTTPWLSPATVAALRALIRGRGDKWAFDAGITRQLWSGKGLYPSVDGGLFGRLAETVCSDHGASPVTNPVAGDGCLAAELGITNLLTSAQAKGEAPNTGGSGDFWVAASQYGHGGELNTAHSLGLMPSPVAHNVETPSKCYLIDATGAGQTVGTNGIPISPSTGYTLSFYVNLAYYSGSNAPNVTAGMGTSPGAIFSTPVVAAATNKAWTRVQLHLVSGPSDTELRLSITVPAGYMAGVTALQLEATSDAVGFPVWHTWIAGGATGVSASTVYRIRESKASDDLTLAAWLQLRPVAGPLPVLILTPDPGVVGDLRLIYDGTYLVFAYGATFCRAAVASGDGWHHVAAVMRQKPDARHFNYELYLDGVLAASVNGPTPYFASASGGGSGVTLSIPPSDALIDELLCLPWGAMAEELAPTYVNSPSAGFYLPPPTLGVHGDWLGSEAGLVVMGEANKASSAQGQIDGIPIGLVQTLGFKLTER